MFSFFTTIIDYIWMYFNYLINLVEMAISLIAMFYSALIVQLQMLGFLPPLIGASVLFVLLVSILKLIIGRDNQ